MAVVHVHPSPVSLSVMQSMRRAPLTSKPNAANSPFRSLISGKRTRQVANVDYNDIADDCQQPPHKKQAYEPTNNENQPPGALKEKSTRLSTHHDDPEATLFFSRKPSNAPVTNLGRKLHAVASSANNSATTSRRPSPTASRTTQPQQSMNAAAATAASGKQNSLDNIRQWQEHYRRAFPSFTFFFDSLPEDVHSKLSRYVQHLGAKELRFFSDQVTHVVTTRPVPPEQGTSAQHGSTGRSVRQEQGNKTIDPSLLATKQAAAPVSHPSRAVQLLQSTLRIRGTQHSASRVESKKPLASNTPMDILMKAREWKQKVWTVEKLQRILETMARVDTSASDNTSQVIHRPHEKRGRNEADLQRLVRNEKIIGPADRDFGAVSQDMVQLRGVYIYIHDIDEKTRPVMVREYNKPEEKEDGKWPQFRVSAAGRCPFIESHSASQRPTKVDNRVQAAGGRQPEIHPGVPRTRSRVAELCKPDHDEPTPKQTVLVEASANLRRSPRKQDQKPLDPPPIPTHKQSAITNDTMPALFGSAQLNKRSLPRMIAGEPVASGVQPSNVTSAIRSQAISSTAISSAVTGMRAGTSKEIHALQRKVLERGGVPSTNHSAASSYNNDVRAALNGDTAPPPAAVAGQRAAKRKAQESLAQLDTIRASKIRQTKSGQTAQKEPKPGYCENCNEKFDDFEEVSDGLALDTVQPLISFCSTA